MMTDCLNLFPCLPSLCRLHHPLSLYAQEVRLLERCTEEGLPRLLQGMKRAKRFSQLAAAVQAPAARGACGPRQVAVGQGGGLGEYKLVITDGLAGTQNVHLHMQRDAHSRSLIEVAAVRGLKKVRVLLCPPVALCSPGASGSPTTGSLLCRMRSRVLWM